MALFNKDRFSASSKIYWQLSFWAAIAASCALLILIWMQGGPETEHAISGGRRLIVHVADGHIEGKMLKQNEILSAGETATSTVQAAKKVAPDAGPTASETAQQAAAEAMLANGAIKSAEIPLAPVKKALLEKLAVGMLPRIATDGTRPWRYYAKPFAIKGDKPLIAIVVNGLGLNKTITKNAINLPEAISLSLSPYAKEAESWAKAARAAGHEIIVNLPLEPTNYPASDPGPYAMMLDKNMQENALKLQWVMSRMQGYIGMSVHENEIFSTKDEYFGGMLELLNVRGVSLILPHHPVRAETQALLKTSKIPHITANIIIDEELSGLAINMRLKSLEKIAKKTGYALGYAHSYPITIEELRKWSNTLDAAGYTLVPVSYMTTISMKSKTEETEEE